MYTKLSPQERLKDLRVVDKHLTLEQLEAQTGLSKAALGNYERKEQDISAFAIATLAKFYGVSTDYLMGLTENKNHPNAELQALHIFAELLVVERVGGFPPTVLAGVVGVDGLLAQHGGQLLEGSRFLAAQEDGGIHVADDGIGVVLVNTYAHIQQSSRVELGRKFEEGFYAKQESPSPQAVPAEGEPTISMTALLELLKNADPEVKAQLRLALLT